jgi:MFS family permease
VSQQSAMPSPQAGGIHTGRLFGASCVSLIATAIVFIVVGAIIPDLKKQFILNNTQAGWIGGAAGWGFTLSIFFFGPLVDWLGMKLLMRVAFFFHVLGILMMIFAAQLGVIAAPFWWLFFGALIIALGNGTVEAVCNPMIATLYPNDKTHKLAQFHMWFPGGIVIGGLIAYALEEYLGLKGSADLWKYRLGVVLVPAVIYFILFTGQKFPKTERVQAGISFGGMVKATLLSPLFIVLFICMAITASLELGPNRWMPSVLGSANLPGILVLVWISGLMAVLRGFAGPLVHKLSNTGVLLMSAILGGIGLFMLGSIDQIKEMTGVDSPVAIVVVAATIFAVGVCYFWPTMLGTVSERVPKGGSLALALMGGWGMFIVGIFTTPMMGNIADGYIQTKLVDTSAQTAKVLEDSVASFKVLADLQPKDKAGDIYRNELTGANEQMQKVLDSWTKDKTFPVGETAKALREVQKNAPAAPKPEVVAKLTDPAAIAMAAAETKAAACKDAADKVLSPAEFYGGEWSFRIVAPFAAFPALVFLILYLIDKKKGGYKAEKLVTDNK